MANEDPTPQETKPVATTAREGMDPVLASALLQAQLRVRVALRTSTNTHHGYQYANSEEVITVGRDALGDASLAWSVEERLEFLPKDCGGACALLHLACSVIATGNGATHTINTLVPVVPGNGRPLDKAIFAARTEGISYALRDLLLIPRKDAPDASGRNDGSSKQRGPRTEPRDIGAVVKDIREVKGIRDLAAIVQAHRSAAGGALTDDDAATLETESVNRACAIIAEYTAPGQVTQASNTFKRNRPVNPENLEKIDRALRLAREKTGDAK